MAMWKPENTDEEADLTPMIDIVFLLIVFFMVVAKLIDDTKIDITVPVADRSKIGGKDIRKQTISMDKDGLIYWGAKELGDDPTLLTSPLKDVLSADPNTKLFFRVDATTEHKNVRKAMMAIAEGGMYDIIFAAYEKGFEE